MHEIKSDGKFRGPTDSMYFDIKCENVHGLALKLEEKGFKTFGMNEELRCYIPTAEEEKRGINYLNLKGIVVEPRYLSMDFRGQVTDKENLVVDIPSIRVTLRTTMKDFKKTFDKNGMVIKAIHEYESTVAQLRKTMQDNLSMAVTLVNV